MRAIYNNVYDSPDTIEANSEATNYEVENTQEISLDKKWRSTGLANEDIIIDAGAGSTFTINSIAIIGHNLTSGATIDFQMNATDAWGAPSVDESITWRDGIIVHYLSSSQSYRFARLNFSDAGNTDGYIEVARVFMSVYLQFDPSSTIEFDITNNRNDMQVFSSSNKIWSREGSGWRTFEYSFPKTGSTMIASLRTMYDLIGRHKPFVFMNFDSTFSVIEPAYVVIMNNFNESWRSARAGYSLTLREVT